METNNPRSRKGTFSFYKDEVRTGPTWPLRIHSSEWNLKVVGIETEHHLQGIH